MAWGVSDIPGLTGKVAVVTGSTDGLGREVARVLAGRGATVVVAGRNAERGEECARAIGGSFEPLDLADLAAVRAFAATLAERFAAVDLLVNNAGVALIPDLRLSADGFEMQMATNYLGHFALVDAMLPVLLASGAARVVNVSSIAAGHVTMDLDNLVSQQGYAPGKVYGRSKLAMLMFAQELDRRARANEWPLRAFAAHPGVAESNLQNAGPSLGRNRRTLITRVGNLVTGMIGQSTAAGAMPILRAATDPEAAGGSYFGPDGRGGLKGAPVVVTPPKAANDRAVAARLWEISQQLTGALWSPPAAPRGQE